MLHIEKLSEKNLFEVLKLVYPNGLIKAQKRINIFGKIMIIDYEVIYNNKIIYVEFDGPTHYTNTKTQVRDLMLEGYCDISNITLIRLPYFIQLDDINVASIFKVEYTDNLITTKYLNGFHDTKIVYPADFNHSGWNLFFKQYEAWVFDDRFDIMKQIYHSLVDKDIELTIGIDWQSVPSKKIFVENYPT